MGSLNLLLPTTISITETSTLSITASEEGKNETFAHFFHDFLASRSSSFVFFFAVTPCLRDMRLYLYVFFYIFISRTQNTSRTYKWLCILSPVIRTSMCFHTFEISPLTPYLPRVYIQLPRYRHAEKFVRNTSPIKVGSNFDTFFSGLPILPPSLEWFMSWGMRPFFLLSIMQSLSSQLVQMRPNYGIRRNQFRPNN